MNSSLILDIKRISYDLENFPNKLGCYKASNYGLLEDVCRYNKQFFMLVAAFRASSFNILSSQISVLMRYSFSMRNLGFKFRHEKIERSSWFKNPYNINSHLELIICSSYKFRWWTNQNITIHVLQWIMVSQKLRLFECYDGIRFLKLLLYTGQKIKSEHEFEQIITS